MTGEPTGSEPVNDPRPALDLAAESQPTTQQDTGEVRSDDETKQINQVDTDTTDPTTESESGERIEATRAALVRLVEGSKDVSRPFDRNVVNNVGDIDRRANGGRGDIVDKTVPVDTGMEGMKQIDVRTYVEEGVAYHLTVVFNPDNPDGSILLSIKSPAPINPYRHIGVGAAGVNPHNYRFQDFLYAPGASEVPVHEADYSFVYDYRPLGHDVTFSAERGQVTQLLQLLRDGTVVKGAGANSRGVEPVANVRDLAPELVELAEQ